MPLSKPPDPGGQFRESGEIYVDRMNNKQFNDNVQTTFHSKQINTLPGPKTKRHRPNSPLFTEPVIPKENITFLVVKRQDGEPMNKTSPFLIDKLLTSACGNVKNARKISDGSLLVETYTRDQAEKLLLNLPKNVNLPVTVEPHKNLNKVKGVITCSDLANVSLEEVKEFLRFEGVVDITRMNRRINGNIQPTNIYIDTLSAATLPEKLKIGYYSVAIRPYVPLPLRCFQCYRYNHTQITCKHGATCPDCAEPRHENNCVKPQKCVNCKGQHSAVDRSCPQWATEKKIAEVKVLEKISYAEAKKRVSSTHVAKSFSDLFKNQIDKTCKPCQCIKENKKETKEQWTQSDPISSPLKNKTKNSNTSTATCSEPIESNPSPRSNKQVNKPGMNRKSEDSTKTINDVDISIEKENQMIWINQWTSDSTFEEDESTHSPHIADQLKSSGRKKRIKNKKK